ncbi:MAG: Hsp20/alpha crystallin family protein [Myxococcota bacterium]
MQTTTQPAIQRPNELTTATPQEPEVFFAPRTDVYETADSLVLVADVPGAADNDISVTFEGDVLTVEARLGQRDVAGMSLAHREYEVGSYRRTFTVHTPIDREAITASTNEGVLRVTLPKAKEARVQKIQVRAGK